ncbi:hypothetical protein QL285_039972 [Trifolium repens]|nr:hypothetical protein QL285_039972 [Trifolium repens]
MTITLQSLKNKHIFMRFFGKQFREEITQRLVANPLKSPKANGFTVPHTTTDICQETILIRSPVKPNNISPPQRGINTIRQRNTCQQVSG